MISFTLRGALAAALLLGSAGLAAAQDASAGHLMISKGWARLNIANRPSAGYVTIMNHGDMADRLVAASSPAFGRVELHTHLMEDGVAKMVKVEAIEAPAGDTEALAPGGDHMMFFDPAKPLKKGDQIEVVLTFEHAGDVAVMLPVYGLGEMPEGVKMDEGHGDMDHGDMDHGSMNHAN